MYYVLTIRDEEFMSHDYFFYAVASKNKQMLERLSKDFEIAGGAVITTEILTVDSNFRQYAEVEQSDCNYAILHQEGIGEPLKELELIRKRLEKDYEEESCICEIELKHSMTISERHELIKTHLSDYAVDLLIKEKKLRKAKTTGKLFQYPNRYKHLTQR